MSIFIKKEIENTLFSHLPFYFSLSKFYDRLGYINCLDAAYEEIKESVN